MNQIHPTAVLGPDVKIGMGNAVGPYAVIPWIEMAVDEGLI